MKRFAMVMLGLLSLVANAQSISLSAAKSFSPSDYLSIRYSHFSNHPFKLSSNLFMEKSQRNLLGYTSYGLDLLCVTDPLQTDQAFSAFAFSGGVGLCWLVENEPWLYKDWPLSKRSSLGLVGEIAGHYRCGQYFSLGLFGQQKILFNHHLGSTRWLIGLRLSHLLSL
jgi:hypothetical protein